VWCAFDREPFNEFLFCLVELCRQSFRTVPALTRISVDDLQTCGEAWADRHKALERLPSSKKNPHMVALAAVFKARDTVADEKEVIEDRMEVPLMTADEARDVQYFLDSFQLGISDVHLLEKRLKDKLRDLEAQNITGLFKAEQPGDAIVDRIDDIADRLMKRASG